MPLVTLHATGYIYPVFVSNIPNLELWERIYYCGMKKPKTHSEWFCDDLNGALDQGFFYVNELNTRIFYWELKFMKQET